MLWLAERGTHHTSLTRTELLKWRDTLQGSSCDCRQHMISPWVLSTSAAWLEAAWGRGRKLRRRQRRWPRSWQSSMHSLKYLRPMWSKLPLVDTVGLIFLRTQITWKRAVSILTFLLVVAMLYSELNYFLFPGHKFRFAPDADFMAKLKLNVDMTVAMPCDCKCRHWHTVMTQCPHIILLQWSEQTSWTRQDRTPSASGGWGRSPPGGSWTPTRGYTSMRCVTITVRGVKHFSLGCNLNKQAPSTRSLLQKVWNCIMPLNEMVYIRCREWTSTCGRSTTSCRTCSGDPASAASTLVSCSQCCCS